MGKIFTGFGLCLSLSFSLHAQVVNQLPKQASINTPLDIVCYSRPENMGTVVPPPQAYEKWNQIRMQKLIQQPLK